MVRRATSPSERRSRRAAFSSTSRIPSSAVITTWGRSTVTPICCNCAKASGSGSTPG